MYYSETRSLRFRPCRAVGNGRPKVRAMARVAFSWIRKGSVKFVPQSPTTRVFMPIDVLTLHSPRLPEPLNHTSTPSSILADVSPTIYSFARFRLCRHSGTYTRAHPRDYSHAFSCADPDAHLRGNSHAFSCAYPDAHVRGNAHAFSCAYPSAHLRSNAHADHCADSCARFPGRSHRD